MSSSILIKKSVCVITGPTRGLGKSIVLRLSKELPKGSLFILLSRNSQMLSEVANVIISQDGMHAVTTVFDQGGSGQDVFDNILTDCLKKANAKISDFEQAILINNAGTLEPLEFTRDLDEVDVSTAYFKTNLSGCITLTAKFLQMSAEIPQRVICNISSLAAIKPLKSWLLYCMAKAARDMMMKVVGAEEENVRTLNYSPGLLQTDMGAIACKETKDPDLKIRFNGTVEKKEYVDLDETVGTLVAILQKNIFEDGAHIDFYDEI